MTRQSTNQMNAFFHGSRPVGQVRQIRQISLLEKIHKTPIALVWNECTLELGFLALASKVTFE